MLCGAGIYHLPQARHSTGAKGCVGGFSRICRLNCSEWLTNHFPGRVVGGHTCTRTSTPSTHAEIPVFSFLDKKTRTSNYGFRKFKHGRLTVNSMANLFWPKNSLGSFMFCLVAQLGDQFWSGDASFYFCITL